MLRSIFLGVAAFLALAASASAQLGSPPPRIPVVLVGGKLVSFSEFRFGFPDTCPLLHFHSVHPDHVVTALDGTQIPDPNAPACGFGMIGQLRVWAVFDLAIPDADFDGIPDAREAELGTDPNQADSNGNGIPDGDEDKDADGLGNAVEIVQYQTDPTKNDTDGNGVIDSVDVTLASTAKSFTVVPLLVNLYQGSGATEQHFRDAVALMNQFYAKARIRFVLVGVRTGQTAGDDGTGGGTAGDGRFNNPNDEGQKVQEAGGNEVAALPGGKGMKVAVSATGGTWTDDASPPPGWSRHRDPACVCEQRSSRERTAATIAHEFGHIFTLAHPTVGSAENTPGNIMTPSNGGRDAFVDSTDPAKGFANLTITPAQVASIVSDGIPSLFGVQGKMNSPAVKRPYQSGSAADAAGDETGGAAGSPLDLARISMASEEGEDEIHVLLELWGPFPDSGAIDTAFGLLFDTDASAATGATQAGLAGVDREVRIHVVRESGSAAPAVQAQLLVPDVFGVRTPIGGATLLPVTVRAGSNLVADLHVADALELRLRKEDLALTAPLVPMQVTSLTPGSSLFPTVADTMPLAFDQQRYLTDPDFVVTQEFADPSASVPFSLAGLDPNAPFEVRFDDEVVATGMLDGSGSFLGTFPIPAAAANGFHFLTATDGTDAFAFSAINVPEASPSLAAAAAALALAGLRRARRLDS